MDWTLRVVVTLLVITQVLINHYNKERQEKLLELLNALIDELKTDEGGK